MTDYKAPGELELHVSPAEEKKREGDLILTPSKEEEQQENADLILEADGIIKFDEITFDGEAESKAMIEEAMKAYDAAMDEAAGMND